MRRLSIAALYLLLGAIVTIVVAWACAVLIDGSAALVMTDLRGVTAAQPPRWNVIAGRRPGSYVIRSDTSGIPPPPIPIPIDTPLQEMSAYLDRHDGGFGRQQVVDIPRWSRAATPPTEGDEQHRAVWEDARGWPLVCLVSYCHDFGGRVERPWSIDLGEPQAVANLPRVLPLRPILDRFAIDAVFFAVVLWAITLGPAAVRRFVRRRRHRCPACGYPVGESDRCTECGAAVSG
jgi:hypothetical protein